MFKIDCDIKDAGKLACSSDAVTEREFAKDLTLFWDAILTAGIELLANEEWNRIIVEIWDDEGYLIGYPHKKGTSPDMKKSKVTMRSQYLIDEAFRASGMDTGGDEEIQAQIFYGRIKVLLSRTYRKEPALSKLKIALKAADFTMWAQYRDDVETLHKIQLFF